MKRLFKLFIFILFNLNLLAQNNLVPNPSFEEHTGCPFGLNSVFLANGWSIELNSADYFHSCSSGFVSTPNAYFGYQCPATGNAYVGVYSYTGDLNPGNEECVGRQLLSPLVPGQKYYVSFKASLADFFNCGIDKLGVLFTTVDYSDTTSIVPLWSLGTPQIYSSLIITDSINWITINGSFIADSAYQYIMIGMFFNDTNSINLICNDTITHWSYYYIDDVCVSTDSLTCVDIKNEIIDFNADSTAIQEGSCINFNINTVVDYDFYDWQFEGTIPNTSTDSMPTNICYDVAGTYSVTLITSDSSGCGDTIVKMNYVTVLPCTNPVALYGYTDSLLTVNFLDSSTSAMSWLWNFGDGDIDTVKNPVHTYDSAGTYYVCLTAFNACGSDIVCNSINVTSTGIISYDFKSRVNVYPNPFSETATIEVIITNNNLPFSFILYDYLGSEVKKAEEVKSQKFEISGQGLPDGIYFYQIKDSKGNFVNGKIVIQ